jgi:hypothetical protein
MMEKILSELPTGAGTSVWIAKIRCNQIVRRGGGRTSFCLSFLRSIFSRFARLLLALTLNFDHTAPIP